MSAKHGSGLPQVLHPQEAQILTGPNVTSVAHRTLEIGVAHAFAQDVAQMTIGEMNPKVVMLLAIWRTCRTECWRGFFGFGTS
jgi:hypothetical protein